MVIINKTYISYKTYQKSMYNFGPSFIIIIISQFINFEQNL